MPVYGFECRKCGHKFEQTLSFSEYEKKKTFTCPKCHGRSVDQVILGAMVQTSKKS
jgi:putative FmdB family regulatory protein